MCRQNSLGGMMKNMSSSEKVIRQLYEITHSYELGFEAQMQKILKMGLERFDLDIGILSKINGDVYTVEHCAVPDGVELASGVQFDLNATYCHITCLANTPTALEHVGESDRYASHPAYQAFGLESYIGMPIKLKGEVYGTLNFSSATPRERQFKSVDIDALQLITSWIENELVRQKQEQQLKALNLVLEQEAYQDSLTSVPNRRAMFKHVIADLNRLSREKGQGTLAILDVDFFKKVNDTYGHQTGDEVLIEIASTLESSKRDYDFLARFGGEEFILWLPNSTLSTGEYVATRVKKAIEKLLICNISVTVSIGLTHYNSTEFTALNKSKVLDQLISEADQALYDAKSSGRNCVKAYQKEAVLAV